MKYIKNHIKYEINYIILAYTNYILMYDRL